MKQKTLRARLRLAPLALVLLANPHISALDILPDATAFLLLLYIFSPLRHLSVHMQTAVKRLRSCLLYATVRIPATVLVFFIFDRYPTENTILPVASLSFFILDIILYIPALSALLRAIGYLGDKALLFRSASAPHREPKKTRKHSSYLVKIKENCKQKRTKREVLTALGARYASGFDRSLHAALRAVPPFVILRALLALLPDLLFLTDDAAGYSAVGIYPFAAFLALLFGIIVAYFFYAAFVRILKPYLASVAGKAEALNRPNLSLLEREAKVARLSAGWILIVLSAFFAADLHFGSIDYLPDALLSISLLAALLLFFEPRDFTVHSRKLTVLLALSLVTGLAGDTAYALFYRSYTWRDIYYSPEAESLYIAVLAVFVCKAVADVLLLLALHKPLRYMAEEEAGFYIENTVIRRQQDKNRRELGRIADIYTASGIIGVLLEFAVMLTALFPVSYEASENTAYGEVVLPALDFLSIVFVGFMLIRAAYMIATASRLASEVRAKYKLDSIEE